MSKVNRNRISFGILHFLYWDISNELVCYYLEISLLLVVGIRGATKCVIKTTII